MRGIRTVSRKSHSNLYLVKRGDTHRNVDDLQFSQRKVLRSQRYCGAARTIYCDALRVVLTKLLSPSEYDHEQHATFRVEFPRLLFRQLRLDLLCLLYVIELKLLI
jgi:hypothetical protein